MAVIGEPLFYRRDGVDLDTVLRHQVEQLAQKIEALPREYFEEKSDAEVAAHVAGSAAIRPIVLDLNRAKPDVAETQVEVRDRFIYDSDRVIVPGLRATKTIPFTGDPQLWELRTNPFSLNPPYGEIRGQFLVVGLEVPSQQADAAKRHIDETLEKIPEYLERQRTQIEAHNGKLAAHAAPLIQQRRSRLGQAADLLNKLK